MDDDLLIRIDENVKYLRQSFEEHKNEMEKHIAHDESIAKDYIMPMWESRQRMHGAATLGALLAGLVGSVITMVVMMFSGDIHK